MRDGKATLEELLRYAKSSDDVLAVYVFGSRGRPDGLADAASDYHVGVVLRDDADLTSFDARWPYAHGAPVEVARATMSELIERLAREHGLDDVIDAWEPDVAWLRGDETYRAT